MILYKNRENLIGNERRIQKNRSAPTSERRDGYMGIFKKKIAVQGYDKEKKKPVIKASICNGEQVAGFKDIHTGKMEEIMVIKNQEDLKKFKAMYGIEEEIIKEY
jgi:hypothetical protein